MAEQTNDVLLREIDDELREERAAQLWKRYGSYVIGAAIVIVGGVAFYEYRKSSDLAARQALSDAYVQAQTAALDNPNAGLDAFAPLKEEDGAYGLLATFQEAALLNSAGDQAGAADAYDAIRTNDRVPELYQGLATIYAATLRVDLADTDLASLSASLKPLDEPANAWRHSARELLGLIALKQGDEAAAIGYFERIATTPEAPQNMRQRADELLTILK